MRIQPVQGTGMNAGYDAATKSITISNEGNSPFIYVRVNQKIIVDDMNPQFGYYLFYDFYEVIWDGRDFTKLEGGLSANYETRETCPKMYSIPYDLDEPNQIGNFSGNVGVSGQGLVYLARYRGVDSGDGRDVYEFFRSLDVSSKCIVTIDVFDHPDGYYSATGGDNLSQSNSGYAKFWAKEINGSELVDGKSYLGFFVGDSYDPNAGNIDTSDKRPVIKVINSAMAGPTGIQVVSDISCVGGNVAITYATIYPSENAYVVQGTIKNFVQLDDVPQTYSGAANYYLSVNSNATGLVFVPSPPSSVVTPSISFLNLNDTPNSYPSNPAAGTYIVCVEDNILQFKLLKFVSTPPASSIIPSGNGVSNSIVFSLVNDSVSPGPNKYYGTDGEGRKGWYDLP